MLLLQLLLIFFLIFLAYHAFKGDFLSPGLLCSYMFFLSTFAAFIGNFKWQASISYFSMIMIITFLISVCLGDLFSRRVNLLDKQNIGDVYNKDYNSFNSNLNISASVMCFLLGIAVVTLIIYYRMVYLFSVQHGNIFGLEKMLKYYRIGIHQGDSIHLSFFLAQSLQLCRFMSYVVFYLFINNIIYFDKKDKINILYLAYVGIAWLMYSLSSSRGGFINFISAYLLIFFLSWLKRENWNFRLLSKKAISVSLYSFLAFMLIFSFLGNGTGKTEAAGGAVEQGLIYIGGSIFSFSDYLKNYNVFSQREKYESLTGIYNILNMLGANYDLDANLPFISVTNHLSTNVYSAIRRYINDFGIIGTEMIGFIMGVFYGTIYKKVKTDANIFSFSLLFYGSICYPLFYISVDEMFVRGVFSVNTIYTLFYFYIIWNVFIQKKIVLGVRR